MGLGSHEGLSGSNREAPQGSGGGALIRDLATDTTKREIYDRLHQHLNRLADEVEQAMKTSAGSV